MFPAKCRSRIGLHRCVTLHQSQPAVYLLSKTLHGTASSRRKLRTMSWLDRQVDRQRDKLVGGFPGIAAVRDIVRE